MMIGLLDGRKELGIFIKSLSRSVTQLDYVTILKQQY